MEEKDKERKGNKRRKKNPWGVLCTKKNDFSFSPPI